MKKKVLFAALALLAGLTQGVSAQTFSDVAPTGQTLYYNVYFDYAVVTHPPVYVTYIEGDDIITYEYMFELSDMYLQSSEDSALFWGNNQKPVGSVVIPDSVEFQGQKYAVKEIAPCAFYACDSITSVTIPNAVNLIGLDAFAYCRGITTVNIPDSVTDIRNYAFYGCTNLTSIVFPEGIDRIWHNAFSYCSSLSDIFFPTINAPDGCEYNNFQNIAPNAMFHVPCGGYDSYSNGLWSYQIVEPTVDISMLLTVNDEERGTANNVLTHGVEVTCDSTATVQAVANEGYRFERWSNGSTDNPYTLHLNGDSSVTAIFRPDDYFGICMVTVQDNHNVVCWNKEFETSGYTIYREGSTTGVYEPLAFVPDDSLSVFVDQTSHPVSRSYRYKISFTDIYDDWESETSDEHKTMHLTINKGLSNTWNLVWTEYEGAEYSTYVIYRGSSADNIQQIDIMPANGNTTYTDDNAPDGDVYYQVGVMMDSPCNPTKSVTLSLSNIASNGNEGIGDVDGMGAKVYPAEGKIVVENADGNPVTLYDAAGRTLAIKQSSNQTITFDIPASGTYLVKVVPAPARRIVVVK